MYGHAARPPHQRPVAILAPEDGSAFTPIGVTPMSAELEIRNGTASMFSVRVTPWHREGHILTAAPSFDDAMALGRLDYTKSPTLCTGHI